MSDVNSEEAKNLAAQTFANEYNELCKKHGLQLQGVPVTNWEIDKYGVWHSEVVVNFRVVPLPKQ